jgi:ABC-2 type transport system ATP-binding protein
MIQIQDLMFSYRKQPVLFDGLALQVDAGSIVGLLGKNGAGKSTLLKLMSGLLSPQDGDISIFNQSPQLRRPDFLKEIFFVPEEIALPSVKIKSYVSAMAPLYPDFDMEKLESILYDFELNKGMRLSKLSYGQKKKFIIAFALSTQCKLLILDEPTNGLDIPSKALFRKVVAGALTEEQAVFISTHQVKDVENLIDRVLVISEGKMVMNRSLFDITSNYNFISTNKTDTPGAIYNEEVPGGYKVIVPATDKETDVDMEVLFNAVSNGVTLN